MQQLDALTQAEVQRRLIGMHEVELVFVLQELLSAQGYRAIVETTVRTAQVDLIATKGRERLAIELKRQAMLRNDQVSQLVSMFERMPREFTRVIAFPGIATSAAQAIAQRHKVKLWGLEEWGRMLAASPAILASLGIAAPRRSFSTQTAGSFQRVANGLIQRLEKTERGHDAWNEYQQLATEIAEFLFGGELGAPDVESADGPRRNRRDFVMENRADSGFWFRVRQRYFADYIVFDAKNHSNSIGKDQVTGFAHYLKPYGLGMFGVLLTRKRPKKAAVHAMREQWAGSNRMIIALSDEEVIGMLERKRDGVAPEEVLSEAIAVMRKEM